MKSRSNSIMNANVGVGGSYRIVLAVIVLLLVTLSTRTKTSSTAAMNSCHAFSPLVRSTMKNPKKIKSSSSSNGSLNNNNINININNRRRYISNKFSSSPSLSPTQLNVLPPSSSLLTEIPFHTAVTNLIAGADVSPAGEAAISAAAGALSVRDTWIIFIAGVVPFAVATVEFWRRVRVGEAFGTGTDSVVFSVGEDDVSPLNSRGRRTLGTGALITAIILFVVSFGTLGIVLYSVITSAPPPPPSSSL